MERRHGTHPHDTRMADAADDAEHRRLAKWLCIAMLVAGATWNTWHVFTAAARGESPAVPFVAAVLMAMVAMVAWRRW